MPRGEGKKMSGWRKRQIDELEEKDMKLNGS
jgi:hypothetical protein